MRLNLLFICFFILLVNFSFAQPKYEAKQFNEISGNNSFQRDSIVFPTPESRSNLNYDGNFKASTLKKAGTKKRFVSGAGDADPLEIYYLNAYNFTIGGPLLSNYLGRLNIFNHSVSGSRWAYNGGFTSINYSIGNADSLNFLARQNVLLDPLADSIKAGQKYLKQFNRLTTKVQNRSFSFFGQIMRRINSKVEDRTDRFQLFFHVHMELLVNKITTTTTVTNMKQDSITQPTTIPVPDSFFRYMPPSYAKTRSYLNGYYGIGLTAYSRPLDSLSIFVQLTVGGTTNAPNTSSVNDQPNGTPIPPTIVSIVPNPQAQPLPAQAASNSEGGGPSRGLRFFYYVHGYMSYNVTKAIQGVVGGEIRGIANYNPYYAVYAGVNLNIESIFSALK